MARNVSDEELQLKKRARRRLVGAIVLVTAVAVVLPMILDSEPKPATQNINIQIPSPDAGVVSTKPAPLKPAETAMPAATPGAAEPAASPPAETKASPKPEPKQETKTLPPEIIVANHASMKTLAFSIITDMCLPDALEPANIERILKVAAEGGEKLQLLLCELFRRGVLG